MSKTPQNWPGGSRPALIIAVAVALVLLVSAGVALYKGVPGEIGPKGVKYVYPDKNKDQPQILKQREPTPPKPALTNTQPHKRDGGPCEWRVDWADVSDRKEETFECFNLPKGRVNASFSGTAQANDVPAGYSNHAVIGLCVLIEGWRDCVCPSGSGHPDAPVGECFVEHNAKPRWSPLTPHKEFDFDGGRVRAVLTMPYCWYNGKPAQCAFKPGAIFKIESLEPAEK